MIDCHDALDLKSTSKSPLYTSWYRIETIGDVNSAEQYQQYAKLAAGDPEALHNISPDPDHIQKMMIDIAKRYIEQANSKNPTSYMMVRCDGCGGVCREMMRCARCKAVRYRNKALMSVSLMPL
jgi:hypothetical protein